MKTIGLLSILVTTLVAVNAYCPDCRPLSSPSGIDEFGRMIKCETGISAANYFIYGCWCGKGGYGTPVDDTDRCCYDHDMCYKALVDYGTCRSGEWFTPGVYDRDGTCSGCSSSNSGCGAGLCRCDQVAARCFASATFNKKYRFHFNSGNC